MFHVEDNNLTACDTPSGFFTYFFKLHFFHFTDFGRQSVPKIRLIWQLAYKIQIPQNDSVPSA